MITISEVKPKAKCSLSGKDAECVVVTFADGSFNDICVSWNALKQLVRLKLKQEKK